MEIGRSRILGEKGDWKKKSPVICTSMFVSVPIYTINNKLEVTNFKHLFQ